MILKKPYAFLIRHFRLIHFLLFIVSGFLLISTNSLVSYTNTFVNSLIYSVPINTVLTDLMYLSIWILVIGFGIITYLLHYKKKPFIEYVIGIGIYILIYILFVLIGNYFNDMSGIVNARRIMALRDFLTIAYIAQYVIVFYLLIKFMGLDLKKFGFKEDKDLLEEDADEEEVEVAFEFDKDKYIRQIKKRIRFFKYYFIEYKRLYIPIAVGLLVVLVIVLLANHETTRAYSMGEYFSGNGYEFRINNAYFTDRDYNGSKIIENGTRKYLIVNIDIKNLSTSAKRINLEIFNLITDTSVYHNNYSMYSHFEDLGKQYNDNYLEPSVSYNYILLFEIESVDFGKDFYITYTTSGFGVTTRKVTLKTVDLTNYIDYLTVKKDEEMKMTFYNGKDIDYKIITYAFKDDITYYYDGCKTPDSCGTYRKTVNTLNNRKILNIKFISNDIEGYDFSKILSKHGKLIYKIGEETKEISVTELLQVKYKGDFLYFNVPEEMEKADYIEFKIIVRDKVYHYILKGEGE